MLSKKTPSSHADLLPISRTEIDWLPRPHVLHDVLDAPGLVLVSLGVIWLKCIFVFHVDAFLQALCAQGVILIRIGFGIVRPYPLG
jgi:hypothetical protein